MARKLDRRTVGILGLASAAVLLVAAFVLGLVSFAKMRQVVAEEFNQQQLVLARNLASLIRQEMDYLRRELLVLNQSPSLQDPSGGWWRKRLKATFSAVQSGELTEIRYVDAVNGRVEVMDASGGGRVEAAGPQDLSFIRWAERAENQGRVMTLTRALPKPGEAEGQVVQLILVTAHYRQAPEVPSVYPAKDFEGALVFVVDASALSRRFTADAQSGTTGYAWVIDERGTFLAHPMEDFIGKSAFKARHEKDPKLAFESINVIMRNHMLRGEEGVGEYVSGWHRQEVGPVDKLMGFCPIRFDPDRSDAVWSVAVVAPRSEVQGMVSSLFHRQLVMQGAIFLAILAGSISVIRMERYWADLRKQKERQVNLSSRLASLGTLAAGVAHEINNPIAIILGFTDLLLEKIPEGSAEHDHLKIIEKQGLACKKIVENLSRFARIPEQAAESTHLNEEIERILAMVRNTLLTEKVRFVTELQDGLPPVMGDPQGIQQVLLNLISNARGAMKDGGTLTVRTRSLGTRVELAVSDTGHGIPRKNRERIFDPFFTTKAPGEGTGLGLSISHGIIEKAGGTISVESRHESEAGPGRPGTTFRVILPAAPGFHGAPAGQES